MDSLRQQQNWGQNSGLLAPKLVLITPHREYRLSCTLLLGAHLLPQEAKLLGTETDVRWRWVLGGKV